MCVCREREKKRTNSKHEKKGTRRYIQSQRVRSLLHHERHSVPVQEQVIRKIPTRSSNNLHCWFCFECVTVVWYAGSWALWIMIVVMIMVAVRWVWVASRQAESKQAASSSSSSSSDEVGRRWIRTMSTWLSSLLYDGIAEPFSCLIYYGTTTSRNKTSSFVLARVKTNLSRSNAQYKNVVGMNRIVTQGQDCFSVNTKRSFVKDRRRKIFDQVAYGC